MKKILNLIKKNNSPFVIAEIGVNYYDIATKYNISLMDGAKKMIDEAKKGGCHAVKFQSYKAEKIASKNSPAYWDLGEEPTTSQYELFKKFDSFGEKEYKELSDYCNKKQIIFLSTPFDYESLEYLNEFMDIYKISSSDMTNLPFIKAIAEKGKPVILSTGACTVGEIERAVQIVLDTGNNSIAIMHCILDYPTDYSDANLNMIKYLKKVFPDYVIGISDHTKPDESMLVLTTAYLYGAKIIEKHFTLDKNLKGNDHYHAMDVMDCMKFMKNIKLLNKINGQYRKEPLECENSSRKQARRSIVARVDIKAGQIITENMLDFKRPGTGIPPFEYDRVVGRIAKEDIQEDELIQWTQI